jgi:hypothetical protein
MKIGLILCGRQEYLSALPKQKRYEWNNFSQGKLADAVRRVRFGRIKCYWLPH